MRDTARNAASMKLNNMLDIIDIVRRGPVSRADVARATGLTRAAVTIIVDRLQKAGILEVPGADGERGRKNSLLQLKDQGLYFMGIDITRVNCSICIADIKGNSIAEAGFALSADAAFEDVLPLIRDRVQDVCRSIGGVERLTGAGVSTPGPVDITAGKVLSPTNFRMLHNQNVIEQLREVVGCGIWLENNAAARTLYEKNLGEGRRFSNFMVMIVDTGVGSGLVLEGRLFRGLGFAGEAGHTSVNMDGPLCACGNRGCLEEYAAIPSLLRREFAGHSDVSSWKDVVDLALAGNAQCLKVVNREARYLAQSIVNTANLLDLEAVILIGFIAYRPDLLLEHIRQAVQGVRITGHIHGLEIIASQARENAGALSAAIIAMEKFLMGQAGWVLNG